MKRIISKVDYEMHLLGNENPNGALELWNKIKDKKYIIKQITEVIKNKDGKNTFFAPSLMHMILSNPNDIDKDLYNFLVIQILRNSDLNRTVAFGNVSFLFLIIMNSGLELDDFLIRLINSELSSRFYINRVTLNKINYQDMLVSDDVAISYKESSIDITLSESEVKTFSNGSHFNISEINGDIEIDNFENLLNNEENSLDPSIRNSLINGLNLYRVQQRNYYPSDRDDTGAPKL